MRKQLFSMKAVTQSSFSGGDPLSGSSFSEYTLIGTFYDLIDDSGTITEELFNKVALFLNDEVGFVNACNQLVTQKLVFIEGIQDVYDDVAVNDEIVEIYQQFYIFEDKDVSVDQFREKYELMDIDI